MSSTTDPAGQRGQILVLFAGALVTLLIVAALAFDVGMMLLERRDEQNAADAAALAGARYVVASADYHGSCSAAAGNAAVQAACELALANGFADSDPDEDVLVNIPPIHGTYAGFDGFLEVTINASRPSIFGGVIGRAVWPVGAYAVAGDQDGVTYSFGMLALNPTACKALQVAGTGVVNSGSNIQSNSNGSGCGTGDPFGFSRSGGGTLNLDVTAVCRSASLIQDQGSGYMTCSKQPSSFSLPDPLRKLPAPVQPGVAGAMKEVVAGVAVDAPANVPDYCPGASAPKAPSVAIPRTCVLGQGGTQAGRVWILHPGLYPGGLDLKGGVTAFLMPGIYWIGGGGFQAGGDVSVISVESETNRAAAVCTVGSFCTGGGGVLIYNSNLGTKAAEPIGLGGSGAALSLMPYDYPFGDTTVDLVIFQDRTVSLTVTLNGSSSQATQVRGIVYVPQGEVKVNGSNSAFTMDQVIADTFYISGSGGTVNVRRETGVDAEISGVGLVE